MSHTYGWTPSLPDQRDHFYSVGHIKKMPPDEVDLRPQMPPVYDQGDLGSCTANALTAMLWYHLAEQQQQTLADQFSRLFVYYNERAIEHSISSDSGASLRDGMKSLHKQGACLEREWTYDITRYREKPPTQCYTDALPYRIVGYQRLVQNTTTMQIALAAGSPFVFGISVYESFESEEVARTGVVPMPGRGESVLGGHALLCVGYSAPEQVFYFRNSWGDWGNQGYGTLPFRYVLSPLLSSDFWMITT